ncbi:MFS transporter [Curvivirga sp.]|uniref:MFS transporter n=1 Tax=Curvivirga sp. TaxID=2856848 RepID=UPI003B5BF082
MKKSAAAGWCMYDWANSAFPTIIMTFIFPTYFSQAVVDDPEVGTALWGQAMALAGVLLAVFAPIFGAIADHAGHRARWLLAFTALCVLATGLLWLVTPGSDSLVLAVILTVIATVAFEFSMVFYNAYLPEVAPREKWGRISGWGWGLGYIGGLCCLVISLLGFVQAEIPWFGLATENAEHVRATFILVAIWLTFFSIPTFMFLPKSQTNGLPISQAVSKGFTTLFETFKKLAKEKVVLKYLIARMFYTDGLNTLFIFGGVYAAGTFGMDLAGVITFGIALNVTAGIGAITFSWFDDKWGPKRVILISIGSLTILCLGAVFVTDVMIFWVVGLTVGFFLGPAQSSSRSLLAHLAPPNLHTEYFGLYALSGKATAFLGPWLLAMFTLWFDSQRAGMAVIVGFFVVGGVMLWRLDLTANETSKGN